MPLLLKDTFNPSIILHIINTFWKTPFYPYLVVKRYALSSLDMLPVVLRCTKFNLSKLLCLYLLHIISNSCQWFPYWNFTASIKLDLSNCRQTGENNIKLSSTWSRYKFLLSNSLWYSYCKSGSSGGVSPGGKPQPVYFYHYHLEYSTYMYLYVTLCTVIDTRVQRVVPKKS